MARWYKCQLQIQSIYTRLPISRPSFEAVRRLRGMSSILCCPVVEHRFANGEGRRRGPVGPGSEAIGAKI